MQGIISAMHFSEANNITLIGMPGVGKSTLGVVLAKILNYSFLDTDLLIQQKQGQTLQELIDTEGTQKFIEIENEVLKSIECDRTIISTGGSAVYSSEAMDHLRQIGRILYLKTTTEDLRSHLGNFSNRGVISLKGDVIELDELHLERASLYEKHAELIAEVQGLTTNQALEVILQILGENIGRS